MARRSKYEASFKAKVVRAALQGNKTLADLSKEFGIAPSMITQWKEEALKNLDRALTHDDPVKDKEIEQLKEDKRVLHEKIGELAVAVDFFSKAYEEKVRRKS